MNSDHGKFFACLHVIAATVYILVAVYNKVLSPTHDVAYVIDDGDDYSPPDERVDDTGSVR